MNEKQIQILVIDGSEVARTVVSRILQEEMSNVGISTCGSAAEATRLLEEEHFDLITTALMLPDRDGLELIRQVRTSRGHHYTPIIVVSGDADARLLREGFAAGVTDYFDKVLGYRAFAEFIKNFTQRNSGLVGRILYVEDSPSAAAQTRNIMAHHGLQVVHTTTAEQAIEILDETVTNGHGGASNFDIVITDFYLKGRLTGGDLLHAIRAKFHYSQQEMPVLVITSPVNDRKQAEVFHAGANDFVTKPIVEEVLVARIRSLLLIKQQFNALKRQNEEMKRLATTDSLTGVRNKRYLLDHGERFITDPSRQPVSAMLLDLDNFKEINDKLGHITGDHVLESIGDLLIEHFSSEVMVVRFGGEEFALLLPRCPLREAQARAEELRRQVELRNPAGIPITISIGLASTQSNPELNLTQLLGNADRALYSAKERGRNQVCA